jgi:pyruvate dehydrogenase E2 component (dihydrolipoamide acetyltransferase)
MPIDVLMPKLSDTMEEGKILHWLKHPGDRVAVGEILAEVETDKANMELEAFDEGTLAEVRTQEGESAPVGAVIATLAAPGEASASSPTVAAKPVAAPAAKPAPRPVPSLAASPPAAPQAPAPMREAKRPTPIRRTEAEPAAGPAAGPAARVRVSPLARKIAAEHDLDLGAITGTGPDGRIVESDVMAALKGSRTLPPPPARPSPAGPAPGPGGRVELTKIRRTTAKRMADAKRDIPHFYASADVAMDEAVRLKEALAGLGGEYEHVTFTHLVLKAVGLALRRVPEVNGSLDGDALVLHDEANVGMATAVDAGLVVPVVRRCDSVPLAAIVQQARGLVERARAGKFAGDDLSGGTFTVSNLGMFPVTDFAAIINPPQAAILAVGAIREVPVVRNGRIEAGRVMTVTLSSDHRVIDGVLAGRFLRELKGLLENPLALVV